MLEKKVIVVGDACYAIEGMVLNAKNEDELVKVINNSNLWEPNLKVIHSFFTYLTKEYCLPGAWQNQHVVDKKHLTEFNKKISCSLN